MDIIPYMLEGGLFLSHTVGQGHFKRDILYCEILRIESACKDLEIK